MAILFLYHCRRPFSLDDNFTLNPSQNDSGPSAVIVGVSVCPESSNLNAKIVALLSSRLFPPAITLSPCNATLVICSYDPDCPSLKNKLPIPLKLLSGCPLELYRRI